MSSCSLPVDLSASNHDNSDEVELISLIEEQIPRYKLRADTITQFTGYNNSDFYIKTPLLKPDAALDLSPDFIAETLDYFVISGQRLSQMTKTYNDIEAVTRLLEEKERDLELAARIGKSLLDQNNDLKQRNDELEGELTAANDINEKLKFDLLISNERVTQLKHEISMKNGLLQIYSEDLEIDESEFDSEHSLSDRNAVLTGWDELQKRVRSLEDDNTKLKTESLLRTLDIENEEKKELQLIQDCAKQLTDANKQILNFQEDVARRVDDNIRQQEEITNLLSQIVDLQRKTRELTVENEALQCALQLSHECQNELSCELLDTKEKFGTLLAAFHELQEELKNRSKSSLSQWPPSATFMPISDSLATELESMGSEGYESEISKSLKSKNDSRCHSPDSVLSNGSIPRVYRWSHPSSGNSRLHLPDKLQIVKPLEGSETLKRWKMLATPHMGAVFEQSSGIQNKAVKNIDSDLLNFALSLKESVMEAKAANENNCSQSVGKSFDTTSSVYTFTTTSLSRTTECTSVTNSFCSVQLSTGHSNPITTAASSLSDTMSTAVQDVGITVTSSFVTPVVSALEESKHKVTTLLSSPNGLSMQLGNSVRNFCNTLSKFYNPNAATTLADIKCNTTSTSSKTKNETSLSSPNMNNNVNCSGLGGLAEMSLLFESQNGVITKGGGIISKIDLPLVDPSTKRLERAKRPDKLELSNTNNNQFETHFGNFEFGDLGNISSLKTMRKGGFI